MLLLFPARWQELASITDANGHATVQFIPGSFRTTSSDLYYSKKATGTCYYYRTLEYDQQKYPRDMEELSLPECSETSVNPPTIEVNETVDVTISLLADGWALQPKPIDAVLCTD